MKKLTAGFVIVLALMVICIYVVIPSSVDISSGITADCNAESAFRVISKETFWVKYHYLLSGVYYRKVTLEQTDGKVKSSLTIVPLTLADSMRLNWACSIRTDVNPLKRIRRYR